LPAPGISSTTPEERQRHLEAVAREEAASASRIARATLRQRQRESATEYGRALFSGYGEAVALALEDAMGNALSGRAAAGPYFAGMLQLMGLGSRGPRAIAAVALGVVVDRMGQPCRHRTMANAIGAAVEAESYAQPIEQRGQDLLRVCRRRHGQRLVTPARLTELRVTPQQWTARDRFLAGAFLLEIVLETTGLMRKEPGQRRQGPQLVPTELAAAVAAAHPPTPMRARRLPMLVPPRPWAAMSGGGHMDNREPLVRSRQGLALDYLDGQLEGALQVVNTLQSQRLEIDPWMVAQQRMAWDACIPGLFPVQRDPLPEPPRPQGLIGGAAFAAWKAERQRAVRDRIGGRGARAGIERSLRQMAMVAGEPVWQAWYLDFRGRAYTSNRAATHQGPDHEKAAVLAGAAQPCDHDVAWRWLLKAAANHWGERGSWEDRLEWGRRQVHRMVACAEEPLDRLELWRDAKDPWQFLACCRGVQSLLQSPEQPIRQLIRLDQTTSGPGIIAALVRDATLGRSTNLIGGTRHDLYGEVALEVVHRLRMDLETGEQRERQLAGFWLERGVSRSLAKLPVMSSVYGAQLLGVTEQLVAALDEAEGEVSLGRVERDRLVPCRYLSRVFRSVLIWKLSSAMALQLWLRRLSLACSERNQPLAWTSPAGFPIRVGSPTPSTSRVSTLLHGRRRWQTLMDAPAPGEISARETGRAISANLIHSFDAALVWSVVCDGAATGVDVLPTHDCFAVPPCHADWLSRTLAGSMSQLYRVDWLSEIAGEIAAGAGLERTEPPPMVGDLTPGQIGTNSYLFS
jgi:DNA-directed RNA polymerase